MYAESFDYQRASSWEEAVALLADAGDEARAIAGGQSLVPMMLLRIANPRLLVDIGALEPGAIERRNGRVVLSGLVRHVELEHSTLLADIAPLLVEAAAQIGNLRVRHRGTLGGSLAHAEPTAELPCGLVALEATVFTLGPGGERPIPAAELVVSHFTTSLDPGELITRVEFPAPSPGQGTAFAEYAARPGDFALAEAAAVVTVAADRRIAKLRLVVSGISDRPLEVSGLAPFVTGERASRALMERAGRAVAEGTDVGPGNHAGAEYRKSLLAVVVGRALLTAAARAEKGASLE
jgi:CO/xanthine dehydrogenase FAD-binding subunit